MSRVLARLPVSRVTATARAALLTEAFERAGHATGEQVAAAMDRYVAARQGAGRGFAEGWTLEEVYVEAAHDAEPTPCPRSRPHLPHGYVREVRLGRSRVVDRLWCAGVQA